MTLDPGSKAGIRGSPGPIEADGDHIYIQCPAMVPLIAVEVFR